MRSPFPLLLSTAILVAFLSVFLAPPAAEAGPFKKNAAKMDEKIRKNTARFVEFQKNVQKRIPPQVLAGARGIVMIHKFKAGIGIGAEAGGGVALVKDPNTGRWSPPAFVASAEGSWGLQFGAQETDLFFVLMNDDGLKILKDGSLNVGLDIQATAGPAGVGGDLDTTTIKEPILVYANTGGLFAGAAFKGGGILPAKKNNAVYYGLTLDEILFQKKAQTTVSGRELIAAVRAASGQGSERDVSR